MEFERAKRIVREAEQLLIRSRSPTGDGVFSVYLDTLVTGPWLVMAGTRILIRRLGLATLVSSTLLAFFWAINKDFSWQQVAPAFLLGVGSTYFGRPSRTVVLGVTSENIQRLTHSILESVTRDTTLELLQTGVTILRTQTFERLTRFNIIAGISWGALFAYASAHVLAPGLTPKFLGDGIVHTGLALLFFFAVIGAASSYAVSVRAIYMTLDFAFLEAKR